MKTAQSRNNLNGQGDYNRSEAISPVTETGRAVVSLFV